MNEVIALGEGAMFHTGSGMALTTKKSSVPAPKDPVIEDGNKKEWALWGSDNLKPQTLVTSIEESDIIPMILDKKAKMLYSGGLVYGTVENTDKGRVMTPLNVPEIDEALERMNVNRYCMEAAEDYYTFNNVFVELRKNLGGKEIIDITCTDATMCRLSRQKPNGVIDKTFVNANWNLGGKKEHIRTVTSINPNYDLAGQVLELKDLYIMMPLRTQSRGRMYYARAPWEGIIDSGWLELAQSIPTFKKSLMENQMSIRWHVEVPDYWWGWKYKNWEKLSDTERIEKQKTETAAFSNFLTGAENAGKTFMSTFRVDKLGKEYAGWKVNPIKANDKGGEYIEDSQEADFHIARSFGIDPTLVGVAPGKGHSSGSGSDKRVAYNMALLGTKPDADFILQPLYVISKFNRWAEKYAPGKRLEFWFQNYFIATLDQVNNEKRA